MLTKGVEEKDFVRCPIGAAAVQLFLQVAMSAANPLGALEALMVEPWPEGQDSPWPELSEVPWALLMPSRWPVFWALSLLRGIFLVAAAPRGACVDAWEATSMDDKAALAAADNIAKVASATLDLPPSLAADASGDRHSTACPAARATAALALLNATSSNGAILAEGPGLELLALAQKEATPTWARDFVHTMWPALPLLATLERRASGSLEGLLAEPLRGVVAYIHFRPEGMAKYHDLETSLASLQRHWLDLVPERWPVMIFSDEESAPRQTAVLTSKFPLLDLRVIAMDRQDLDWPMVHDHPSCSAGYRRAARFTAGPLYMHKALDNFTHLILVDTEFVFTHPVPWDPLRHLYEQRGQLAYWQTHYEQTWNRTLYLTEVSREFMASRGFKPQIPELVQYWWDVDEVPGGTLPVNIYGCLFAGSMSFFRSEPYQSYFKALDIWTGWDEHCWSPQSVLAIAAGFFLSDNELNELWVFGTHQASSKTPEEGWNLSKMGVFPFGQRLA